MNTFLSEQPMADGEHFAKIEMPATYKFKNGMGVPLC